MAAKKTTKKVAKSEYNKGYEQGLHIGKADGEWAMYELVRKSLILDLPVCTVLNDEPVVYMRDVFRVLTDMITEKHNPSV